ncbi:VanZ family protein [Saccharibacillus qingshengii]|uniref:VanZ family protein n=1 Tax=Saccharibacillus qingshengii TaxID=1763540 RepID=UPI001FE8B1A5|nr:VanZ family protein [Saccharibacillus qingshengii]
MLKSRKNILIAALLYTAFIVYVMFFAFGRTDDAAQIHSYTFIFAPGNFFKLPDLSELLSPSLMDLVSLGNVAAFIPFGILVPLLRPIRFVSFLGGFILSILILETVQALTFLGSFDLGDVLTNALGASIGFGAYRLGMRAKTHWKRLSSWAPPSL